MSQALTMVRSFLPGSSSPHGADFSMTAQCHRCWPRAWRAPDGLSGVWNCWWSYQDERVQGGHSRCMKGCRKPEVWTHTLSSMDAVRPLSASQHVLPDQLNPLDWF